MALTDFQSPLRTKEPSRRAKGTSPRGASFAAANLPGSTGRSAPGPRNLPAFGSYSRSIVNWAWRKASSLDSFFSR